MVICFLVIQLGGVYRFFGFMRGQILIIFLYEGVFLYVVRELIGKYLYYSNGEVKIFDCFVYIIVGNIYNFKNFIR